MTTARLFLLQRASAGVLAIAVLVHLATIIIAVRGGLTASEILGRTSGNAAWLAFYALFVVAAALHAPIGLRNILREWIGWRGPSCDLAMAVFATIILVLGLRAAWAVYAA